MAKLTGQAQGVAVSSGTAALYLALMALRVGTDDEVVIPSYVCTALWHAVRLTGAKPVLVDIEPATYQPSPQAVAHALTSHTKAVIVPHMFGLPADIETLKSHGIPVIEDCALTLGVTVRGTPVGGTGKLAICSFSATKLLTAGQEHGYFRYVVRLPHPVDPALDRARTLGIGCRRPVYRPIHRYLNLSSFPETDAAWERALSIPLYPALTDHEVDRVASALPAILAG